MTSARNERLSYLNLPGEGTDDESIAIERRNNKWQGSFSMAFNTIIFNNSPYAKEVIIKTFHD